MSSRIWLSWAASLRALLARERSKGSGRCGACASPACRVFRGSPRRARGEFVGFQKLAVAENRRQRIVQFVCDAGNQLTDGDHLLALQELLLRAAQRLVGFARLFEQQRFVDGGGDLIADGGEQIQFGRREIARLAIPDNEDSHNAILRP